MCFSLLDITDAFRGIFRDRPRGKRFTLPMIHVYGFSKAEDPEFDLHEVCLSLLKLLLVEFLLLFCPLPSPPPPKKTFPTI